MCNLLLIWLILALLSILCTSRGPQYLDVPYRARVQQVLTDLCGAKAEEANALLQIGAVSYRYRCKSKIIWQKAEQDQLLDESMQVRYYNPPTRYPACYQDDWEARLLKLHDDYIVINKPHGLPCMAHPSNSEEHLTPCVKRAFNLQDLFLTHRLDAATTGIVLIARSKDSQRYFSGLFDGKQHSRISKVYKALTRNSLPLGSLHHYQYKKTVGAQILSNSQPSKSDGWKLSEMTILSCKSITTVAADESQLYESEIKLLTGRKHQIRAQFAAIKSPILNDTLYQAVDGLTLENFEDVDSMMRDSRYVNARAPCGSIGLHANRLDFIDTRGDRISISCPPPWTNR